MTNCPLCETPTNEGDELFDHLTDHGVHELAAWVSDNH